jgi:integrase/recombinase XerD
VRGFLDYAWRSGRAARNALDGFALQDRSRRRLPSVLSVAEASRLVRCCPTRTAVERRDRMIIVLLYSCGLRTDELCRLNVRDVSRERRELFVRRGKGGRQRVIAIPEAAFTELLAYLLERGGKQGALLRTEAKNARISSHLVCNVVRRAAERAGLAKYVTPKTLRHSYATHLKDRGVNVGVVSSLMGHRSVSETGVYLHVPEGRLREAVDKLLQKPDQGGRLV